MGGLSPRNLSPQKSRAVTQKPNILTEKPKEKAEFDLKPSDQGAWGEGKAPMTDMLEVSAIAVYAQAHEPASNRQPVCSLLCCCRSFWLLYRVATVLRRWSFVKEVLDLF
jgi:hypothetical protein